MKFITTILLLSFSINFLNAQNINWATLNENQQDLVYLNFGYDFGMTTQLGYGYRLNSSRSILLTADYSFPAGKNLVDDFKIRIGGQVEILRRDALIMSAKVYGLFRRHETTLVKMSSFGSESSVLLGYYKSKWHIAGEFGFDKSGATKLKHSNAIIENVPTIKDGWYTSTAGHFFYGIQGSKSIRDRIDLSLRIGATNAQGKDQNPLLPFYGQIGFLWKM